MKTNRILEFIGRWDNRLAERRLRPVSFKNGDLLGETGQPIDEICFPNSSLISIVVELGGGDRVEAAVCGYQSVIGASAAFGECRHINTAVAQLPGSALVMSAKDLRDIADGIPQVRNFLYRHQQYLMAQAQQTAACNAKHHIPARLATWLLRVRDATGLHEFEMTQEFIAQMLGVQRPSVSIVAHSLQESGLISVGRGRIGIANEARLESAACECFAKLQQQHKLLFSEESLAAAKQAGAMINSIDQE